MLNFFSHHVNFFESLVVFIHSISIFVPLEWSMLDGARQIELDGVLHSINEAGTTLPTDRWYGAEDIVDRWLPDVLDEIGLVDNKTEGPEVFGLLQQWTSNLCK